MKIKKILFNLKIIHNIVVNSYYLFYNIKLTQFKIKKDNKKLQIITDKYGKTSLVLWENINLQVPESFVWWDVEVIYGKSGEPWSFVLFLIWSKTKTKDNFPKWN